MSVNAVSECQSKQSVSDHTPCEQRAQTKLHSSGVVMSATWTWRTSKHNPSSSPPFRLFPVQVRPVLFALSLQFRRDLYFFRSIESGLTGFGICLFAKTNIRFLLAGRGTPRTRAFPSRVLRRRRLAARRGEGFAAGRTHGFLGFMIVPSPLPLHLYLLDSSLRRAEERAVFILNARAWWEASCL